MSKRYCQIDKKKSEVLLDFTRGKTAFVYTFGCQQNEADSEKIRGILASLGYALSEKYEDADIIILNTCAIRKHAEDKALSMLGNFKVQKRKNPDLIIGVCGCMAAQAHIASKIKTDFPYVTFTLEPASIDKLPELILSFVEDSKRSFVLPHESADITEGVPTVRKSSFSAWVSIMYGCNNFCSYCIVPYVRGRERSRNSEDIISECTDLINEGYKEITLLGQNVNSYNSDIDFPALLEKIALIDGDFRISFMTSHPKDVSDRLIEVMARYRDKIMPYFHLPLQSGSDRVLKLMNRTYTRDKFLSTVKKLREAIPDIVLSTDVIVAFPTESEEDFNDTLRVISEAEFDMAYSFIYSKREGTRAASMDGQIERTLANTRLKRLVGLCEGIAEKRNKMHIGKTLKVLINKKEDRLYTGKSEHGITVRFSTDKPQKIGEFIDIRITDATITGLVGETIKGE